jgi:hypothetical protein
VGRQGVGGWHAESALGRVELHPESSQIGEDFSQIVQEGTRLLRFHDDIVHVCVNISADLILQAFFHAPLVGGACIFQAEWHSRVAISPYGVMNEVFI